MVVGWQIPGTQARIRLIKARIRTASWEMELSRPFSSRDGDEDGGDSYPPIWSLLVSKEAERWRRVVPNGNSNAVGERKEEEPFERAKE